MTARIAVRLFALSALLTAGFAALGAMAAPASVTTSGAAGDADAIACRHIAGSSQSVAEICSHDHAWLESARSGKDLAAAIQQLSVDVAKVEPMTV